MSRRMNACLKAVVCDDTLVIDDPLLDEDSLERNSEEAVVPEEEGLEAVEVPWSAPVATAREVTQDELDATRMYLGEIGFSPCSRLRKKSSSPTGDSGRCQRP